LSGDADTVVIEIETALNACVDPNSDEALALELELISMSYLSPWALRRNRPRMERRLAQDRPEHQSTLMQAVLVASAEMFLLADGDREKIERFAERSLAELPFNREPHVLEAQRRLGWMLCRLEQLSDAEAHLRRLLGFLGGEVFSDAHRDAVGFLAYALVEQARYEEALALVEPHLSASDATGHGTSLMRAHAIRAALGAGDRDRAGQWAGRAEDVQAGESAGDAQLFVAQALHAASDGKPAFAAERFDRVRELRRRAGARNPAGWPGLDVEVACLLQLGRRAVAEQRVAADEPNYHFWGTPGVVARLLRARALLTDDPRLLRQALAGVEHTAAAHETRCTLEALARFDGAEPLTKREREVVELAAQGLSDKEIGTTLGIVGKTASNHLAAAGGKLGVRGRVPIARALADRDTQHRAVGD
jgi:ATP/maltotriose-dependent transcriptional regulator MalT